MILQVKNQVHTGYICAKFKRLTVNDSRGKIEAGISCPIGYSGPSEAWVRTGLCEK